MALTGSNNEEKIWNYLKSKGFSDFGVSGLMGNLYAESGLNPKNLQNTGNKKLNMTDDEYVYFIDNGIYTKEQFIYDKQGAFLAQWTFYTRKKALYEYAKSKNKSIGDLEMQLEFLCKELKEDYSSVFNTLKTATSVLKASNSVLLNFERPANQSSAVQNKRAEYGQVYYDKYAKKETVKNDKKEGNTMAYDINKVINIALGEVGYLEKKSNKSLDSKTANAGSKNYTKYGKEMHELYPSVMDFPAAWCDCFVDWCFQEAYGVSNAKGLLGGNFNDYTVASAQLYKNKKAWYKSPKVGDQIFFKNSSRICHTGLVYKVTATHVYTVEGNTSSAAGVVANGGCVATKKYLKTYSKIAGYGRPNYGKQTTSSTTVKAPTVETKKNYLEKGDKGSDVKELQKMLIACGYSCGSAGADGDYGNDTVKAVKKFQKAYKLTVDGIAGQATMAKLKEVYKKKTDTASEAKVDSAAYYDKKYNANYKTTSNLNLRVGAGSSKKKIATIPKGKTVECYGYYSKALGKVWLLVKYDKYTGFCSIGYLKKK